MNPVVRRAAAVAAVLAMLHAAPVAAQPSRGPATLADVPGPVLADRARAEETYGLSVHSRPNADEPSKPNATCRDCHGSDTVPHVAPASPEAKARRLADPARCGRCHEEHLEEYAASIHGKVVLGKKDPKGATCSDCHNSHGIDRTGKDAAKLAAVRACASCHKENAASYSDTYHGQVTTLGYTSSAKCFNCHGSHDILPPDDPKSKVHAANRLTTCRQCHKQAGANFASFQPHGNAHDFARYPQIWLATNLMLGVLVVIFALSWVHVGLWLFRELKERGEAGAAHPPPADRTRVRRFGPWWRLGHLVFAVTLMLLTLTGMSLTYANTAWAPVVVDLLGGPEAAALLHRANAALLSLVLVVHLTWMGLHVWRRRGTFRWFGPDSLVPSVQDARDAVAMFRWFLGRAPRPVFDRWTYWEKVDYWAPLFAVTIVAATGFILWFPGPASKLLPGWAFNVAAITHGQAAFLAAVYLFTVHLFNNHLRPGRFPFDDAMFTGSMPREQFAREHALHYRRLVETGELEKYLVDAPSAAMQVGSRVLGFVLIAFGLVLLLLIANGFYRNFLH